MKNNIRKFIFNKNTLTMIGAIIGVVIIYMIYNNMINQAVTLVSVPIAKTSIGAKEKITEEAITYVKVPKTVLAGLDNIETSKAKIIDKLVNYNCTIQANSFFFTNLLTTKDKLSDPSIANIKDGYTVFTLSVTLASTLGNSIYPGNYIDLYIAGKADDGKVLYAKLIESIQVLDVKDTDGQRVFESTTESRIPSNLLFAVPDEIHQLLEKAKRITQISIVPVLRNKSYSLNPTETKITSKYLQSWILSKAETLPTNDSTSSTTE